MTSSPATPIRVVLIDDSEDLLVLVRGALERSGKFEVVGEAADGEHGVASVASTQPDLVLLDVAMPVMDGLQALPLILQACPSAVVVMLSAFDDTSEMPHRAMALGANGYIHKGGRIQAIPEQLCVIVRGATAQRAAHIARHPVPQPVPQPVQRSVRHPA